MFTPFSNTSCVIDSRAIVGASASRRAERDDAIRAGRADGRTMPHDDLARLALLPDGTPATIPRDDLAHRGLSWCGEPGQWLDAWM
jgi:hypothetical protein